MRTLSKSIFIAAIFAASAMPGMAADSVDFVMSKGADGKVEFMPGASTSQGSSTPSASASNGEASSMISLMRAAGTLLVAAGVGMLIFWQHRRKTNPATAEAPRMKLLERLPLGARRELFMVQACDRILVIGCHGNQMMTISDLVIDSGTPAESFNEELIEKSAPKVAERVAEKVIEKPVEKVAERVPERVAAKAPEKPVEKVSDPAAEREMLMRSILAAKQQAAQAQAAQASAAPKAAAPKAAQAAPKPPMQSPFESRLATPRGVIEDTIAISSEGRSFESRASESRRKDWPELKEVK